MKYIKLLLKTILFIVLIINVYILASGKTYVYKAVKIGYMRGHNTATIEDIQFFDTRLIETGKPDVWPEASDYNTKELSEKLRTKLEQTESIAFTVIQGDSVKYEEYWGIGSKTSRTNSFSMGKSIVSILIGIAIDEGYIESVDQKIIDFIPEYDRDGKHFNQDVTIKHLLTMSSGMDWHENYYNPFGVTAEAYFTKDLEELMYSINFTDKPGEKWRYLSGNTQLMGIIVARATGKSLSEYASEKLWIPMGATDEAEWMLDDNDGVEKAYCCFNSNALDFARFGQLYLDHGKWKGKQLVDSAYVAASLAGDLESHYGYSWWLYPTQYKYPVYNMRGVNGQYVIVIPELDLVAVRLGHKLERYQNNTATDLVLYIEEIIKQYE
jgi:CubicO group peptidase (beta-lactamase class C family)